jgi:DNA-binding XRE family transcriptional regulator
MQEPLQKRAKKPLRRDAVQSPLQRRRRLMGSPRPKPLRLAEKLRQIRTQLGLSQTELLERMGLAGMMHYGRISEYEQGKREPNLMTLLAYARTAQVHLEDIVADEFELPRKLPGKVNYRGISRKSSSKRR